MLEQSAQEETSPTYSSPLEAVSATSEHNNHVYEGALQQPQLEQQIQQLEQPHPVQVQSEQMQPKEATQPSIAMTESLAQVFTEFANLPQPPEPLGIIYPQDDSDIEHLKKLQENSASQKIQSVPNIKAASVKSLGSTRQLISKSTTSLKSVKARSNQALVKSTRSIGNARKASGSEPDLIKIVPRIKRNSRAEVKSTSNLVSRKSLGVKSNVSKIDEKTVVKPVAVFSTLTIVKCKRISRSQAC